MSFVIATFDHIVCKNWHIEIRKYEPAIFMQFNLNDLLKNNRKKLFFLELKHIKIKMSLFLLNKKKKKTLIGLYVNTLLTK